MKRLNFTNDQARHLARLRRMRGPVEVLEQDDGNDGLEDLAVVRLARRHNADETLNADDLSPRDFT